jgi:hypothetical protein
MNTQETQAAQETKETQANNALRLAVILLLIAAVASLRLLPHPWNFTPIGALALFGGAMLRDKRAAFLLPLALLFAGDLVLGFYRLMPIVYASFLVSVLIGFLLRERRTAPRVAGAALLGSVQFYLLTNFAVWAAGNLYPRTAPGLAACYAAALPFFRNTLASDLLCAAILFGSFALAEHFMPVLRLPAQQQSS